MDELTGRTRHRLKRGLFGGTKLVLQVEENRSYMDPYPGSLGVEHYTTWRDATADDVIEGKISIPAMED